MFSMMAVMFLPNCSSVSGQAGLGKDIIIERHQNLSPSVSSSNLLKRIMASQRGCNFPVLLCVIGHLDAFMVLSLLCLLGSSRRTVEQVLAVFVPLPSCSEAPEMRQHISINADVICLFFFLFIAVSNLKSHLLF